MTINTVLATTLTTGLSKTGSQMTGSVSLTIILASSKVTRSRCPFLRTGSIFFAYAFCFLWARACQLGWNYLGAKVVPV